MRESDVSAVRAVCAEFDRDPSRLMDIARRVQTDWGKIDTDFAALIAQELSIPLSDVQGMVSFYSFLRSDEEGVIPIRLCDDVVDRMAGYDAVRKAFEKELGIKLGGRTSDGRFSLGRTACIGMSDQAPAALLLDVVVTRLTPAIVPQLVAELRHSMNPKRLVQRLGDGNNSHALVGAMVENNLRMPGQLLFSPESRGEAIKKAVFQSPIEVIRSVKAARLRGRGGAGFPCGMKWEFARAAAGKRKFVICNADEGEPGTFKDRVLLTEHPDRLMAGLTIAGYAIGAREGIIYLRAEYAYLREFLEMKLERRREDGLLGKSIGGREGFDFDIRIQMGAGAYICGEETALINSCEGLRGDPRNRPPFPAQEGYLGCPTVVNNVETLCCVTKIMEQGAATFASSGSVQSSGTKALSISGDCELPGVYEVPFGTSLAEILELSAAQDTQAVLVGGPSGRFVPPTEFERKICFDDLATGGAIVIFNHGRDLLEIAGQYMEFFVDESCGYCAPCRAGNPLLAEIHARVRDRKASPEDLELMRELATSIKRTSRCGLGQTAPNPILSTMDGFPALYECRVREEVDGIRRCTDLRADTSIARGLQGAGINGGDES